MKKIGLTLGKFAPLHKGHQYLIETALLEMDELIVVIYDTPSIEIPLSIRAKWIKQLYPTITVLEAWDGPDGVSNERQFEILQENFIINIIGEIKITAFYSSESYGEHMANALNAVDRRVDEPRKTIGISASLIRENPYKYKEFIHDLVYRDLIVKVVFLGAMSTGKSTITEALAKRFNTSYADEYGRDYWTDHQIDRRIPLKAFNDIALGHIEREEKAFLQANKYCFIDTNAITTYMFSMDYHGKATKLLKELAMENAKRYDLFFLCEDDIPYDATWDRSGDQKRQIFHKQIIADLKERRIPYISLFGDLETRIKKVEKVLKEFTLYSNFFGKRF